jgi:hypothetical protein
MLASERGDHAQAIGAARARLSERHLLLRWPRRRLAGFLRSEAPARSGRAVMRTDIAEK